MSSLSSIRFTTVSAPVVSAHLVTSNFESDFSVLFHGVPGFHPDVGPQFAADTAVWGYKQIRQRNYYWFDKKKLMERIIRSTNIALWQKQRDDACDGGVCVDGVCAIFGEKMAWVASFGQSSAYVRRQEGEQWLMGKLAQTHRTQLMPLGKKRYEFLADIVAVPLDKEEQLLFAVGDAADQPVEVFAAAVAKNGDFLSSCPDTFGTVCQGEWAVTCARRSAFTQTDTDIPV